MIERVRVPVKRCLCEVCLTEWLVPTDQLPMFCRNLACRSRNWNGKKQLRRSHVNEIVLPSPHTRGRPKTAQPFFESED
ncbi:MAG: hypothetical protein WBX22_12380 [Silvibacterium sp.]